jgi:hypothetical protein
VTAPTFSATTTSMSTAQKVQQHPVFIQAQDKASYYASQLDKEVSLFSCYQFSVTI